MIEVGSRVKARITAAGLREGRKYEVRVTEFIPLPTARGTANIKDLFPLAPPMFIFTLRDPNNGAMHRVVDCGILLRATS
jgi:hypothetical protein